MVAYKSNIVLECYARVIRRFAFGERLSKSRLHTSVLRHFGGRQLYLKVISNDWELEQPTSLQCKEGQLKHHWFF
jgi:hypothetical protein